MSNVMCSSGISFQLLFEVTSVGESSSVVTVLHFPWAAMPLPIYQPHAFRKTNVLSKTEVFAGCPGPMWSCHCHRAWFLQHVRRCQCTPHRVVTSKVLLTQAEPRPQSRDQ
jgi:hypothetical protein